MSFPILDEYVKKFPSCEKILKSLPELYQNKLWNELTLACLQFVYSPEAKGKVSFGFYSDFVKRFQKNIDPSNLLKIFHECLLGLDRKEALECIGKLEGEVSGEESKILLGAFRGCFLLPEDTIGASEQLNKVKEFVEGKRDIDTYIHSCYYRLGYSLYAAKRRYKQFYLTALQFLAYTQPQEIEESQKLQLLFEMAVAVLVSDQIYNFSELLEQPMLATLRDSQHAWLYKLLEIFNRGDINEFQKAPLNHEQLSANKQALDQKIRLMAFLELAFNLPKNNRVITFATLAKTCQIPLNHVEFMIMKAMALDLVKGSIDQLKQQVTISWVAPKVLEVARVGTMLQKFEEWEDGVKKVQEMIQIKV